MMWLAILWWAIGDLSIPDPDCFDSPALAFSAAVVWRTWAIGDLYEPDPDFLDRPAAAFSPTV